MDSFTQYWLTCNRSMCQCQIPGRRAKCSSIAPAPLPELAGQHAPWRDSLPGAHTQGWNCPNRGHSRKPIFEIDSPAPARRMVKKLVSHNFCWSMNIRWLWMSVIGLLVIDILSGDSIDIAVALIATPILACPICRQHLILQKSPKMA